MKYATLPRIFYDGHRDPDAGEFGYRWVFACQNDHRFNEVHYTRRGDQTCPECGTEEFINIEGRAHFKGVRRTLQTPSMRNAA